MRARARLGREDGQALVLVTAILCAVLVGTVVLGGVARGVGLRADQQGAADLAALSGARAMRAAYPRLFEPALVGGRHNPRRLAPAAYMAIGRAAAIDTARRNGAWEVRVTFPDGASGAPLRVRVHVADPLVAAGGRELRGGATAVAALSPSPGMALGPALSGAPGEYGGPFAIRQGKPMRPDVALAFDRLAAAAGRDGVALVIASAFRGDAEQARLFAARPDPRWVAPPGRSLHRLGTELDLGPPAAYAWLARNAPRFHFVKRYSWEPWHFGFTLNAGSSSVGFGGTTGRRGRGAPAPRGADGPTGGTLPAFVPARFAPAVSRAAMRWNVSGALLAAQLQAESGFDPGARSPAGAQGIAQFMPGTARAYGLRNPHDPVAAIDAQAHLMRDLLRRFGSVPLALAAYNAGPGRVAACGCVPPIAETVAYVARIVGALGGAGDPFGAGGGGFEVRLVA